jgi:flagellar protein FlaG
MNIDLIKSTTLPSPIVPAVKPVADGTDPILPPIKISQEKQTGTSSESASESDIRGLEEVLRRVDKAIEPFDISLKFSRDEDTGSIVIQMVNQQSGETLQQIPSEATLRIAAELGKLQGLFLNRKA